MDTKGLPLFVMVTPADMTDRNAAKEVLFRLRLMHPEITIVWADSAYDDQAHYPSKLADSRPPARLDDTDHLGPDGRQCHQEVTGPGSRP